MQPRRERNSICFPILKGRGVSGASFSREIARDFDLKGSQGPNGYGGGAPNQSHSLIFRQSICRHLFLVGHDLSVRGPASLTAPLLPQNE